jgi:hypothetical protein
MVVVNALAGMVAPLTVVAGKVRICTVPVTIDEEVVEEAKLNVVVAPPVREILPLKFKLEIPWVMVMM